MRLEKFSFNRKKADGQGGMSEILDIKKYQKGFVICSRGAKATLQKVNPTVNKFYCRRKQ